jgi:hypothetical protein
LLIEQKANLVSSLFQLTSLVYPPCLVRDNTCPVVLTRRHSDKGSLDRLRRVQGQCADKVSNEEPGVGSRVERAENWVVWFGLRGWG